MAHKYNSECMHMHAIYNLVISTKSMNIYRIYKYLFICHFGLFFFVFLVTATTTKGQFSVQQGIFLHSKLLEKVYRSLLGFFLKQYI